MSKQPTTPTTATPNELPCPECGELVRKQLIRCWNCGAFMHKKLEAKYQAMQANPAPIIFSLPEGEAVSADDDGMGFQLQEPSRPASADSAPLEKRKTATERHDSAQIRTTADVPATPHSVATGGDALLDIAMQEEAESQKRRKKKRTFAGGAKTPGGFIIFCPYGCHIEVKDAHRGMTGRCPKCKAPFIVPVDPPDYAKKESDESEDERPATLIHWMDNLHLHVVSPEKLKLKADSLLKEFVEADVACTIDGLVVVTLQKKAGGSLFGGGGDAKKKPDAREAVRQHFADGKPAGELTTGEATLYKPEVLNQLRVAQPVASRAASMFAGVPVFGENRIAIQLPSLDDKADSRYLSLGVLQYRQFAKHLAEHFLITGLEKDTQIPMTDSYQDYKCHYMEVPIKALKNLDWYKADPTAGLTVAGYRCGSCGMAVCEAARNKEKLGGKGGKGIAKVKCPKCSQKMGENPLYSLAAAVTQPAMSGEQTESAGGTGDTE